MHLAHQVLPEQAVRSADLPSARGARSRASQRIAGRSDRGGAAGRRPRASGRRFIVRHRIGGAAQGDGRRRSGDTGDLSRHRMAVRGDAGLSRHPDRDAGLARCPFDQAAGSRRCRARIRIANCGFPIPMPAAGSAKSSRWRARWRRSTPGSTAASVSRAALRAEIPVVEDDGARLKFNPFANVSREEIAAIYAACQPAAASARWRAAICRSGACPAPAGPRPMKMPAQAAGAAGPRRNAASIRRRLRSTRSAQDRVLVAQRRCHAANNEMLFR